MGGPQARNNPGMHLPHREHQPEIPLDEADCYAHSYGDHALGHVDRVDAPEPVAGPDVPWEPETPRHVTTDGLKRQFEERLAARGRSRTPDSR